MVIINWFFDLSYVLVSIILIHCIIFKGDHNRMKIKVLLYRKLNLTLSLFDDDVVVLIQSVEMLTICFNDVNYFVIRNDLFQNILISLPVLSIQIV